MYILQLENLCVGIAGLKFCEDQPTTVTQERSESPVSSHSNNCPTPPVTPSEIPHTPVETHVSDEARIESLQSTMQSLRLLSQNDSEDADHNHTSIRRNYYYN